MEAPVKIYFENKKIVFSTNKHIANDNKVFREKFSWTDFIEFTSRPDTEIYCVSDRPHALFRSFASMFNVIDAAGGLVEDPDGYWLFIFRRNRWDLPKGMTEKGESARAAAIREVEEECGIPHLSILHPLPHTYHVYPGNKGNWMLKKTSWFFMKTPECCQAEPQVSEGIIKAEWKSPERLGEVYDNTFGNIKDTLDFCLSKR